MRYLIFTYESETERERRPAAERRARVEATFDWYQRLQTAGVLLRSFPLHLTRSASTLADASGPGDARQGPALTTEQQLTGVYWVETPNLEHALQWASQHPCSRSGGAVEVRPVMDIPALD